MFVVKYHLAENVLNVFYSSCYKRKMFLTWNQNKFNDICLYQCFSIFFIPSPLFTLDTSFSPPKPDKANTR